MRFRLGTPTPASHSLLALALILAATSAGCDTGPDTKSPEVQKQVQQQNAAVQKQDENASKALGGKKGGIQVKSIKGRVTGGQP